MMQVLGFRSQQPKVVVPTGKWGADGFRSQSQERGRRSGSLTVRGGSIPDCLVIQTTALCQRLCQREGGSQGFDPQYCALPYTPWVSIPEPHKGFDSTRPGFPLGFRSLQTNGCGADRGISPVNLHGRDEGVSIPCSPGFQFLTGLVPWMLNVHFHRAFIPS